MKIFKVFGVIGLLTLSMACAVNYKVPSTRFMNPETTGETFKGEAGGALYGTANIKLIKDVLSASPTTDPFVDEAQDLGLKASIGVIPRIDGYLERAFEGPYIVGGKFQLLGDTRANSKQGNFSVSIYGGYIFGEVEETSSQNSGQANEIKSESTVDGSGYEVGAAIGYRVLDPLLTYISFTHMDISATAKLDQTDSGVATPGLVNVKGEGEIQAIGAGFVLGRTLFLQAEAAYTMGRWTKTTAPKVKAQDMNNFVYGVYSGLNW